MTDSHAATRGATSRLAGVRHVLATAVEASALDVGRAEVRDADGPVTTLHRDAPRTTRVTHRLPGADLEVVLEGGATAAQLERLAETLAGSLHELVGGTDPAPPLSPDPISVTIDLAELEELEHRIRTRLTVARGWVDLLRTRGPDPSRDLDPLGIASRQLADIEDVLRVGLARARTGADDVLPDERADLLTAVEHTLGESTWSVDPHVHGPLVDGEPRSVPVDRDNLRDALLHLLDNATHHTPRGTIVEVHVTYRVGWVELAVEDAGPGLPDATRRPGGVGMQVIRRSAVAMGAHLEHDRSTRLGGAAIRLLWPR